MTSSDSAQNSRSLFSYCADLQSYKPNQACVQTVIRRCNTRAIFFIIACNCMLPMFLLLLLLSVLLTIVILYFVKLISYDCRI